jgi:hypothetical protein
LGELIPFKVVVVALAFYLPMMGLSVLTVLVVEKTVLRRIPRAQRWLGLLPISS